ncbi:MAG: hypothetical protein ACRDO8_05475, partial [Nocardioidaceae bacterium]
MRLMRSLVAALLGLGALLLTALALPAMWTERNVVDEDGYVAFTAPLASDHELQSALAQVVAQSVVDNTRVPPAARPVVQKAAARIAGLPGYSDAWRESNRRSHRAVFGDPRDRSPKQDGSDRLVVDVGPFAQLVVDRVNDTAGTHLEAPGQVVVNVGGSNQQRLVERLRSLDPLAYVLAGAAVLLAICSVLLARGRGAALAWLGVGAVAVAGVLKLLTAALLP